MKRIKALVSVILVLVLILFSGELTVCRGLSPVFVSGGKGMQQQAVKKTQQPVKKKTAVKTTKKAPAKTTKSITPVKKKYPGTVEIGTQLWAVANLDVITFRNGDTIPEARTNQEWIAAGQAGKPAWCYYNNDPAVGKRFGKLYNWYAVNDPRGLAPEGWIIPGDQEWLKLAYFLGGSQTAGLKMKNVTGWSEGDNGTNESGFTGLPGGYRVENGAFANAGKIGIWWSTSESRSSDAYDYYLFMGTALGRSSNPKLRGESVRCIIKQP